MKTGPTFGLDFSNLKNKLEEMVGKRITVVEHKTRNKHIERKGKLTLLTDKLFTFEVPLGRTHSASYSYTYGELEMGKVEIIELVNSIQE